MDKKNIKIAGFSLIELLFAMLFLSIIVFGVIKLQTSNLTLSNTKQLELKAHSYAAQGLEIVEAVHSGPLPACNTTCSLVKSGDEYSIQSSGTEDPEAGEPGAGLFARSFTHDETGLTNASLVTMKVEWTDSSGTHNISAKRVIAD